MSNVQVQKSPIKFWFVCKDQGCKQGFQKIDDFIEHKKERHWAEFQTTTCILFEERHLCHVPFSVPTLEPAQTVNEATLLLPEAPPSFFAEPADPAVDYYESTVNGTGSSLTTDLPPSNNNTIGTKEEIVELSVTTNGPGTQREHNNSEIELKTELILYENARQSNVNSSAAVSNSDINETLASSDSSPNPSTTTENLRKCRLCKKQPFISEQELRIHLDICILHHRSRRRFCLPCNRLYPSVLELQKHQSRIHGTAISGYKRGRGRPRKNPIESKNPSKIWQVEVKPAAHPQKRPKSSSKSPLTCQTMVNQLVIKRGRGRPRKNPLESKNPSKIWQVKVKPAPATRKSTHPQKRPKSSPKSPLTCQTMVNQLAIKRGRGRPRKYPLNVAPPTPSLKDHLCSSFDLTDFKASDITKKSKAARGFICIICKAYFKSTQNCLYHALSHTGEKPFSCKLCNKSYTHYDTLKKHLERDHT